MPPMPTPRPIFPAPAALDVCEPDELADVDVPLTEPEELPEVDEPDCESPDDTEDSELDCDCPLEDSEDDLLDGAETGIVVNDVMGDDSDGRDPEWDGMDTDGSDALGILVVERETGGRDGTLTVVASVAA
ncbi:hypothetical protein L226DRAFT_568163 [Lentinus tigrinus ALCF2SS1-7]|uniref:uncharacterized protein n=1 Tax=Lentinus tigrinus ALCF2SS1-7 TaxID=1328758 RepID=UPI001165ED7B|nr:hypothetical protein L226DRAFT_568163 [Lentinus tigrinus ALCF2SS1-7]